ncbi:GspE/PulE family protein [Synechococcus sp. PCC 6312]|uniref:GspE/PulE family protein n=1 Tax=Synechococcus sp. (strain ATCC 27167 / PCC 6312) TaxID=195253 RepID=UPI00029F219F|nr:GspE/PulE family protein [Synechococcus sp. PCC 6312]AFY59775.1 type II secretory pathway, ATPase PulE/Tfp pilus assembly pathway, ATPase PilB [Synechococcus sp. PCC 6312]
MVNTPPQRRALTVRRHDTPTQKALVESGYASSEQVREAMAESRKSGRSLVQVLQDVTGRAMPPDILRQYKKQQLFELKVIYGIDCLDPDLNRFPTDQIGQLIGTVLAIDICRTYQAIPISMNRESDPPYLLVAMVDPDNLEAVDNLGKALRGQGLTLRRMVITLEDYQHLITPFLEKQLQEESVKTGPAALGAIDLEEDLDAIGGLDDADGEQEVDLVDALKGAEDAPIIALVNKVLAKALQDGVSDIHIEPQEEFLRIRFRKDGVLQQAFDPLPKKIIPAVVSRFKILADLDIAERRAPQDGRIRKIFQGRRIDFRVNTLPSRWGEKVVLRILDNSSTQLGLDKLISDPESLAIVRDMTKRPFGLILVTGPTGSGKTTTLYSALAECNSPGVNISTAEDPIEYTLPGLTQVQVIREKNMNFSEILRAFLRQDPDVILVGETRDKETAKTAIEAALTGHLVLTTLHTNDAASAVARLSEMEVEPFMVSASLIGVVAQRLMRRVCSECRIPYQPTREELARFGLSSSQSLQATFYKANRLTAEEIQVAKASGAPLCSKCGGIGYKGRIGVYEILRVTERLQSLITEAAPTEQIKEAAVEEGMKTLLAYSLQLVQEGHTTFEEVERVTFTDTGLESELKAKRKSALTCRVCSAGLQQEWLDCPFCMTPRFES